MEEARTGENPLPPPPRRRPENQTAAAAPPLTQKCPRCESANTKFCYYNNYSLSQPRYFCKTCRRYWTHGGTLRNVPVGGGCRKTKRPSPKPEIARSQPFSASAAAPAPVMMPNVGHNSSSYYSGGAFLSSLAGMQSITTGGGGMNNIDANMALLRNLQSMKQNDQLFQSLNINPARPGPGSWTQSFFHRGSTSGPSSSNFWSRDVVGNNQAGSNSFYPNQWPDNINNNGNNNSSAGFDPSR